MMAQQNNSKKCKSINTSVPSFRFNATAEEIEELYVSDHEQKEEAKEGKTAHSDVEGSPCKLNKLNKRSTSIDASSVSLSPPADPWRFFSDIRGKITKSVEGKLTEYKSKADNENSPLRRAKGKDNKERDSPSLSESEEFSESSISRTCGFISTTEGVEMSSDEEETDSMSDKKGPESEKVSQEVESKRNVTIVVNKETKGDVKVSAGFLEELKSANLGLELPLQDIESGIDALSQIDNIEVNNEDIIIYPVSGSEIRKEVLEENKLEEKTIFAPQGFVDLRPQKVAKPKWNRLYIWLAVIVIVYLALPMDSYTCGFLTGTLLTLSFSYFYFKVLPTTCEDSTHNGSNKETKPLQENIVQFPSVTEERPKVKYQGWANEYPDKYDPSTYHVSQTQSVFLRLHGNMLRISNTPLKIPKRALYNEPQHRMLFVRHRIYNLLGAQVALLPKGLTKIRHWSKKYPICVTLNKDQLCYDMPVTKEKSDEEEKKESEAPAQIFSKLLEDSLNMESEYGFEDIKEELVKSPSGKMTDYLDSTEEEVLDDEAKYFDSVEIQENSWVTLADSSDGQTCLHIFARTDREKEHWFRRLTIATHKCPDFEDTNDAVYKEYQKIMSPLMQPIRTGGTYSEFMSVTSKSTENGTADDANTKIETQWLNSLIFRIAFDCQRSEFFLGKLHERLARKLASIKLPIFIESLRMTELSLGKTSPKVLHTGKPYMDDWGLWTDFSISYEGSIVLIVTTKLNLMKLQSKADELDNSASVATTKSPIYHSDVEDSAESSSDEDSNSASVEQTPSDPKSKRFMKMMDRLTESKLFQRATENKYIKKAIQGVSNTDVGLKVEVKKLQGCLVVNIPPPPTDRIWIGFRAEPMPELQLCAQPVVGEKNWNIIKVSSWIEKKLYREFLKICLLPNMEDVQIPFMMQELPQ